MSMRPERVFIGLGSNQGDRQRYLAQACAALAATPGIELVVISPTYESAPQGGPRQRNYLNAVVQIRTRLTADALLVVCKDIEKQLGRRASSRRWGPRRIDLDILLYGRLQKRSRGLTIPHPRLAERWFVLQPLHDIAPQARHPRLRKTIRTLLHTYRSIAA